MSERSNHHAEREWATVSLPADQRATFLADVDAGGARRAAALDYYRNWAGPSAAARPGSSEQKSTDAANGVFSQVRSHPRIAALGTFLLIGAGVAVASSPGNADSKAATSSTGSAPTKAAPIAKPAGTSAPKANSNAYGVDGAKVTEKCSDGLDEMIVTFPIGDNLTSGLIRAGMATDVWTILQHVQDKGIAKRCALHIVGTMDVQNSLGRQMPATEVLWTIWNASTVRSINIQALRQTELSDVEAASCSFGANPVTGYKLQGTQRDCVGVN